MGLRELLILVLILAIVAVILRGLYVALRARRGQLRMALEKNVPQYDPEELALSELPNGGARLVERSFAQVVKQNSEFSARDRLHNGKTDQAIPVLMDTIGDGDDEDSSSRHSSVASARRSARRHIMGSGTSHPTPKPVYRPIDRMPAQVNPAVTTVSNTDDADIAGTEDADTFYADPLDSHVFSTDDGYEDKESEFLNYDDDEGDDEEDEGGSHEDDLDPDEMDDEDQDGARDAEADLEDDFDDFDEDDEDDDVGRRYDESEEDDSYDEEDNEDEEDEFDDDYEDEDLNYEAESFDSVYVDEHLNQPSRDTRSDSYAEDTDLDADDGWDDESGPEQAPQNSVPRRWWQWAGDKLSGIGVAGDSAAPDKRPQRVSAASQERAEPMIGSNAFVDNFDTEPAVSPESVFPRSREPLDKSRQNELSLDEPEEMSPRRVQEPDVRMQEASKEQPQNKVSSAQERKADSAPAVQDYNEVLVLNVVAKPDREFSGVDLLQVLLSNGMRFGDMSIFHLHVDTDVRSPVVFSVANIVNPGTFDLNMINDFSTRGLCFFMTLPNVANSMQAFERMLDTAQAVRVTLDGDLKDDNRSVMTAQTIEHYRQRVRDFDLRQLRQHK
jgi:cell division protein ZipA